MAADQFPQLGRAAHILAAKACVQMNVDLAAMAKQKGVKRTRVPLRPIVPTAMMENELYAIYAVSLRIWAQAMIDVRTNYEPPAPVTTDAPLPALKSIIDSAAMSADNTVFFQTQTLGKWVARVGTWHGQKTIGAVKSALGVDIEPFIRLADVQDLLDQSIAQNVSLIRDINAKTRSQVEAAIYDAFARRLTKKELTDKLAGIMDVTKRRARLIAGDQLHKLSLAMTSYRNQQLGIETYDWETMRDKQVRPAHRSRQGHLFRWDTPPWDGHPGYAPGCRCHALPIVDLG